MTVGTVAAVLAAGVAAQLIAGIGAARVGRVGERVRALPS